ncbi:MAG: FAD-dependent oxidoreductase [Verrucomicrobia bacterium]|nr:FAD-dependent oxidoreductase [Verrucomicrobiota bacterium]
MSQPRKIRCTVEAITDHGERVYTVDLAPRTAVPAFRAGQFLHLTVDPYDPAGFWPESRVFSIASSPHERRQLRICYSVKGRYTTLMERTLQVGGEVWVKLPYGDFIIDEQRDAVLIAGGTGISAFTALLEALAPQGSPAVTLVYGVRTPGLLLFREMMLRQLAAVPKLKLVFFTETADAAFAQQMSALPRAPRCLTGRIDLAALCPPGSAPGPATSVFYLSGPPVMLKALATDLQTRGIARENIRTDAWE